MTFRRSDGFKAIYGHHYYCDVCSFNSADLEEVGNHTENSGHKMYGVIKDRTFDDENYGW